MGLVTLWLVLLASSSCQRVRQPVALPVAKSLKLYWQVSPLVRSLERSLPLAMSLCGAAACLSRWRPRPVSLAKVSTVTARAWIVTVRVRCFKLRAHDGIQVGGGGRCKLIACVGCIGTSNVSHWHWQTPGPLPVPPCRGHGHPPHRHWQLLQSPWSCGGRAF